MQILRAANYKIMPWKNGMGSTTEIAVSPDAEGIDGFDWRVSMATVATDGPFSLFPAVDRTLLVLDGNGIVLAVDGRDTVRLDRQSAPHDFAGDVPTSAALIDGPIVDLNIMIRRESYQHRVTRFELSGVRLFPAARSPVMLFVEQGAVTAQAGAAPQMLHARDAVMLGLASPDIHLASARTAKLVMIEFERLPGA